MNRNDYKKTLDQIEPDAGLQIRLAQRLLHQKPRYALRKSVLYVMASLLVFLTVGIVSIGIWKSADQPPKDLSASIEQTDPVSATPIPIGQVDSNAITIPKIELPNKTNAMANMIGLVVYKGNIYTQTSTYMAPEIAESLLGEKLGQTKGNIDEWSKPSDYNELASTIGVTDIYSVKGYDSDFRIMSYQVHDGQVYAELYEHLNGITISTGEDLIGKTNLQGNVESANWQDYNGWYYSKAEFNTYPLDQTFHAFVTALYEAKPIDGDKLYKEGINNDGAQNQKVLFLKLKDQTEITLWLYKGNYVKYAAHVFFQLDSAVFSALWDQM